MVNVDLLVKRDRNDARNSNKLAAVTINAIAFLRQLNVNNTL